MNGTLEVVSDQLASAGALMRHTFRIDQLTAGSKLVLSQVSYYVRRYWWWALYFVILRKLLRVIRGPKRSRRHSRRHRGGESRDGDSDSESRTLFSSTSRRALGNAPVVTEDGVIVINRDDGYVEVYERKRVVRESEYAGRSRY